MWPYFLFQHEICQKSMICPARSTKNQMPSSNLVKNDLWDRKRAKRIIFHEKIRKYDPFGSNLLWYTAIFSMQIVLQIIFVLIKDHFIAKWCYLCLIWAKRILQNVGVISWISRDFEWWLLTEFHVISTDQWGYMILFAQIKGIQLSQP